MFSCVRSYVQRRRVRSATKATQQVADLRMPSAERLPSVARLKPSPRMLSAPDYRAIWDANIHALFILKDADAVVKGMDEFAVLNHVPTLKGALNGILKRVRRRV